MRVTHIITRLVVGGAQENTIASVLGLGSLPGLEVDLLAGPTSGPEGSLDSDWADATDAPAGNEILNCHIRCCGADSTGAVGIWVAFFLETAPRRWYGGAVGGPKQSIGQELMKRLHTRTEWKNLYVCGDSTEMGMGAPAVTVSTARRISARLRKLSTS